MTLNIRNCSHLTATSLLLVVQSILTTISVCTSGKPVKFLTRQFLDVEDVDAELLVQDWGLVTSRGFRAQAGKTKFVKCRFQDQEDARTA